MAFNRKGCSVYLKVSTEHKSFMKGVPKAYIRRRSQDCTRGHLGLTKGHRVCPGQEDIADL